MKSNCTDDITTSDILYKSLDQFLHSDKSQEIRVKISQLPIKQQETYGYRNVAISW